MNFFALFFQDAGGSSPFSFLYLVVPLFLIFYFLLIRPQKKQQEELKSMLSELKSGDEVVTNGGVIGKIIEVRETSFYIRSADKSILEVAKTAVVGRKGEEEKK